MSKNKPSENRTHKDSLFVDYFSKDRDWKKRFLSLYNALHGTDLQVETTTLERTNIKQVLYKNFYNDISVMVNGQLIILIEHQSTINPNMPLRLLEYITRIYSKRVKSRAKFSDRLIPLPMPEFYVFYTGNAPTAPEYTLRLSDAFILNQPTIQEYPLELVVKVCRIKGEATSSILQRCPDLEQYMQFVELVEEGVKSDREEPLTWAIRQALRQGLMVDYLERNGEEILSILMAEYDYATDIAVKQEEAYEDGFLAGTYEKALETARNLLLEGLNPVIVARCTNLSLELVQDLALHPKF